MIHLLEIGPELDLKKIKKLARRYAMTGGYEVALRDGLSADELLQLIDLHLPEALQLDPNDLRFQASNAYRVLKLVRAHPDLSSEAASRLDEQLYSPPNKVFD